MANPDHLRQLCEGARAWNAWRDENPDIVPDLAGAELALGQRQFGPSNGGPINLRGANLERSMLRHATLVEADLEGAILRAADLAYARLNGAKLSGADLTGALLDQADFLEVSCDAALIAGTNLASVGNLTQSQINAMMGDRETVLPADLKRPLPWCGRPHDIGTEPEGSRAGGPADPFDGIETAAPELEDEPPVEPPKPISASASREELFDLLGLEPTATADEIRKVYRKLAKIYHPDLNPGDEAAAQQFKTIDEAHRLLLAPPTLGIRVPPPQPFYRSWAAAAVLFLIMMAAPTVAVYWFMSVPLTVPSSQRMERTTPAPSQRAENVPPRPAQPEPPTAVPPAEAPVQATQPIRQPEQSADKSPAPIEQEQSKAALPPDPKPALPTELGEASTKAPAMTPPPPQDQLAETSPPVPPPPAKKAIAAEPPPSSASAAVVPLLSSPESAATTPEAVVASDESQKSSTPPADKTEAPQGLSASPPANTVPAPTAPQIAAVELAPSSATPPAEPHVAQVQEEEPALSEKLAAHASPTQLSPLIAPRRSMRPASQGHF